MSEPASPQTSAALAHRLRRMSGRDPHEPHRVATPLELLFDLTFVIAFGVAASQLAHAPAAVVAGYEWQGHHRTSRALQPAIRPAAPS